VGRDSFDEGHLDGADETTSGEILNPIAKTVGIVADEHISLRFRGEFVSLDV
jgi:hypothetical protein